MATVDINHPPAGGFQNGGWYWDPSAGQARQFFGGAFGAPGVINNPGQVGFGQPVDNGGGNTGGGGGGSTNPDDVAGNYIKSVLDDLTKPLKEAMDRASEFDKKNPFVFDEALAKSSAEERLSPYYTAELKDYLSGVDRAKGKTTQDTQRLLTDLSTTTEKTTGELKQNIEETIRNTQEGYANNGLLSSGTQERATGKAEVSGDNSLSGLLQNSDSQKKAITSNATDANATIDANLATYQRKLNAEKDTTLTNDVLQQKQESLQRKELERQQFIGYPVASGTSSLSSIFGLS
jgi:hypothetical protein